jgi:flagellar biogenesis protein FliO
MESRLGIQSDASPGRSEMMAWVEYCRGWVGSILKSRKPRRLRVRETLSLGERRFLAVIQLDQQEFLVGGTGQTLTLMARVGPREILAASNSQRDSEPIEGTGFD